MNIKEATARINAAADLSATTNGRVIEISMYGRPIGRLVQTDIDSLGHTPTGWGKRVLLTRGATQVWHALHDVEG